MGAYGYPLLIGQLLHTPLANAPGQIISYADQRDMTYLEFAERIARLGSALAGLGLGHGAVVAVMDWDSNRYLESFFAVPMLGATLHTVNIRLSPEQILFTINHAEDDAILVNEDFLPVLLPLLPRVKKPVRLILLSEDPSPARPEGFEEDFEALLAAADPDFTFSEFDENTRATLFYTTGTTGDPKGVSYSHRQLVLHTLAVGAGLGTVPGRGGLKRDDVYMPITPLFHVHGWGFPYLATMLGLRQIYPGRYDPARLLALIEDHGVTFSHCVPTILSMLLSSPEAESTDLSRWKVLIGGSALPEGLARQAVSRGIDVRAAYGMSETCPFVTTAAMMDPPEGEPGIAVRTATGKPVPMVQLRVVDPGMRDVPMDGRTTGEVIARAPWLTQGYVNEPQGSAALWAGGWLHTGDVGYRQPDGTLRITDRLKDVIKSGGEWISSLELESIVSLVPGVAEVAAVGIPDDRWGERPVLVLAPRADATDDLVPAIRAAISAAISSGKLQKWAAPDSIHIVAALPKTSVGKLDKKAVRRALAEGGIA